MPLAFLVDENLGLFAFRQLLGERGHTAERLPVAEKDPPILSHAEERGLLIVTADKWFVNELKRQWKSGVVRYRRVGVIQVPGESTILAQALMRRHLPLIEFAVRIAEETGHLFACELKPGGAHFFTDEASIEGSRSHKLRVATLGNDDQEG